MGWDRVAELLLVPEVDASLIFRIDPYGNFGKKRSDTFGLPNLPPPTRVGGIEIHKVDLGDAPIRSEPKSLIPQGLGKRTSR
jgi:hypothetical protein